MTRGTVVEPLDFKLAGVRGVVAGVTIDSSPDSLTSTSDLY